MIQDKAWSAANGQPFQYVEDKQLLILLALNFYRELKQ